MRKRVGLNILPCGFHTPYVFRRSSLTDLSIFTYCVRFNRQLWKSNTCLSLMPRAYILFQSKGIDTVSNAFIKSKKIASVLYLQSRLVVMKFVIVMDSISYSFVETKTKLKKQLIGLQLLTLLLSLLCTLAKSKSFKSVREYIVCER